jgi:ribonuclease BN (tRNA processing enzyme)
MGELEIIVLGVGDAFSDRYFPSALLLACDGFHLAIDCPDRYRAVLRSAEEHSGRRLDVEDVDHVLVTHIHGDHLNGLEGLAFYKRFAEGKRIQLLTSPELGAVLWNERLKASMGTLWDGEQLRQMEFGDYFEHQPLSWSAPAVVGPFRIRARRTIHHVPTSALVIEAGGRTLGYSSDTAFDPELIAFLAPADLIIHETNLGPAHTPSAALAELPAELRERMRLIHFPDGFDPASSAIRPLNEGEVLRLGRGSSGARGSPSP